MIRIRAASILAFASSIVLLVACRPPASRDSGATPEVSIDSQRDSGSVSANPAWQTLAAAVKRKEYVAIGLARSLGAPALPTLSALAKHEDGQVRALVIACLAAIGGASAEAPIVEGLLDPDEQVRIAAYQALYQYGASPKAAPALLAVLQRSSDPRVRKNGALVIGRIAGVDGEALRRLCSAELDPEAKEGCVVALAKLGDREARTEFLRRLAASPPRAAGELASPERRAYLEYADYLHSPWLLRALLPLLDDRASAIRIGVDGMPGMTEYLRVCDVAVNLAAAISKHAFTFRVDGRTNYAPAAIDEVRLFLNTVPP